MAPLDLLVVGDIDVDIYLQVPRLPGVGEKVRGQLVGLRPGGVAANVAVAARRLGLHSGVHGVIGDDEHGHMTRAALEREDVDTRALVVDPTATTFLCVVHLDSSGEKALTLADTGCLFPSREQLDLEALRTSAYVHAAPFDLEVAARAIEVAAAAGAFTSVDLEPGSIGRGRDDLTRLLVNVDLCFVNHHAAQQLSPTGDPHDAIAELHELGPAVVVLTMGDQGATVSDGATVTSVVGVPAQVVDSTGAGDAFCAAFLAAHRAGRTLDRAAREAVTAGALACGGIGAQTAAPTRAELDAFLERRDAASVETASSDPTSTETH